MTDHRTSRIRAVAQDDEAGFDVWLPAIVAIIAMLIYVIGMSVCYVSDEVVAPRLRYQRYRREQRRAMRHAERQMVQSDLE